MKKTIPFLLLTIMTLLSNVTIGQTILTYTVVVGSTTDVLTTTTTISYTSNMGAVPDSIIYEVPVGTTILDFNLMLENSMILLGGTQLTVNDITNNGHSYTDYSGTVLCSLTFTSGFTNKIIFAYTLSTVDGLRVNSFTCYVRNYHVVKQLPVGTVITGITGFDPNITTYTANVTTAPTTITGLPTGWVQTLTNTVGTSCITSYGVTDCATTYTLTVINPDGDLTYTFTYNRPAQTPTDPLLSVGDIGTNEIELTLYPNPTTDVINFNSNNEISKISVFSLGGQLMVSNAKETSINVSNLSQGYYIVHIELSNTIVTKKFLKFKE